MAAQRVLAVEVGIRNRWGDIGVFGAMHELFPILRFLPCVVWRDAIQASADEVKWGPGLLGLRVGEVVPVAANLG
jgi:hypothetical protein